MWTRESLVEHLTAGGTAEYLLFWGHTPKSEGTVDPSCLSQWYPSFFVVDGVTYATAEHWMMAEKARLFGDDAALANILRAKTPSEAKALGRTIRDYSEDAWERVRVEAVVAGNLAKFSESAPLRHFLESTRDRVLVEASPNDGIWGIGMSASDPDARLPARWRGRNLLGFALMEVRARLVA